MNGPVGIGSREAGVHGGVKFHHGSAKAARIYLESDHSRADDYYLKEGAGLADRYLATPDGITQLGSLDGDGYEQWVHGYDQDTGVAKGRIREDPNALRYCEVTINGPKTWSLAAALHPEISDALDQAQDQAAREIVAYVAAHSTTRVGGRGKQVQVPVEEIEAAVIRHYTSRAGDPHRHVHLQINARVKAAGAWRGIHSVGFLDQLQALNGIGHAAVLANPGFRDALAAHGFSIDFTSGEIAELQPYVGAFSARAAQIQANLDRYEAQWRGEHPGEEPGPKLRQIWDRRAWADARPDKGTPVSGADLVERWNHELTATGYTPPAGPVEVLARMPGVVLRDPVAELVVDRLAAKRSSWNAADIRGATELLLAEIGLYADPAVRTELAEDITARALRISVPLSRRTDVPEHIRHLTSQAVLDTEAEIITRLADRGQHQHHTRLPATGVVQFATGTRPVTQGERVLDALTSSCPLVVVEGAAGSGKTSLLRTAQIITHSEGHRMMVVTPTRKAAEVAARETKATAHSAAWLAHQHGYRWADDGTRAFITGTTPSPDAALKPGDLLVIDEAGMLDQDTAQALLRIADTAGARVAFIGDRYQLPAVGRGGVFDHALAWAHPSARVTLERVHRFTDPTYATIAGHLRTGKPPEVVFDQLLARGQIVLHPTEVERTTALADLAAGGAMVIADRRDHVARINATAAEHTHTTTPGDWEVVTNRGERIGLGDMIATRRNNNELLVANRQTFTVTGIGADGTLIVNRPGHLQRPDLELPADYVREHVELAYATTVYGAQGETVRSAHVAVSDASTHNSIYVAMSRGRETNVAHFVADTIDDARAQWVDILGRDRADLGPAAARVAALEAVERYGPTAPQRWPAPTPEPARAPRPYGPGLGI